MNNSQAQPIDFHTAIFPYAKDLSKSDILCYQALGALGNAAECQAWQDEIAAQAGLSERQTQRSLKKLETLGLINVDRSRRNHLIYRFAYPKPAADAQPACRLETTHESSQDDKKLSNTLKTTKKYKSKPENQLTLIENDNLQNLGSLDIDAQSNLAALDINPAMTQPFSTAPRLIQTFTPAQILLRHDSEGEIADNLARWSAAWREGRADLVGLKPALIWCKIVEGQAPPLVAGASVTVEVAEVLSAEQGSGGVGEWGRRGVEEDGGGGEGFEPAGEGDGVALGGDVTPFLADGGAEEGRGVSEAKIDPLADLWGEALAVLAGQMTRAAYGAYLASSKLASVEGNLYTIAAPSALIADWIAYRLSGVIKRALAVVAGSEAIEIRVIAGRSAPVSRQPFA